MFAHGNILEIIVVKTRVQSVLLPLTYACTSVFIERVAGLAATFVVSVSVDTLAHGNFAQRRPRRTLVQI